ncbi:hypothetical protein BAU15_06920 [Enterococcus sp. JM4C]|uniref:helix-turn-helix domain-containing protein n=1 Tax=Candidatus Enterococcus huntleyi TaxID=1857217 RepID=UPI00137A8490|nr:helix-turn-helix domain-containing protein [Enterococcus sp. JM4C]KAF1297272.1 hypothetical protein BAU15_06920 [Enterococcus sp. JM4C]
MIYDKLLTEEGRSKLKILSRLGELGKGIYSIHLFEKELRVSYVKASHLIHTMASELSLIDPQFCLLNARDKIEIVEDLPPFEDYQRLLCKRSLPYHYLLYILLYPTKNISDFCLAENISLSTVVRKLPQLIAYFNENKLHLNRQQMKLTGKESVIRLIFNQFIWSVSTGEEVIAHFKETEDFDMTHLFSQEDRRWLTYGDEREWNLHQAIAYLRVRQGYRLEGNDYVKANLPGINQKFRECLENLSQSDTVIKRESYLIGFFMFYRTQYFTLSDPRVSYIRKYSAKNLTVSQHTKNFYNFCKQEIFSKSMTAEQEKLLWIDLFTVFLQNDYFPEVTFSDNLSTGPLMVHYHPAVIKLKEIISTFLDKEYRAEPGKLWNKEGLLVLLSALVLPYIEKDVVRQTIRIGVIGVQDTGLLHFLFYQLQQVEGLDMEVCGNVVKKDYDLLLSSATSYLPKDSRIPYYILDPDNVEMVAHIQTKIEGLSQKKRMNY